MELKHRQPQIILRRRLLIDNNQTVPYNSFSDNDSEFDTNMVIIISFLLCTLLLAIGLNAFARCGLFRIFQSPSHEQASAPGLTKRALRELPVVVYGSGADVPTNECPICLGEFVDGERVRVLPKCSHGFHVGCIDRWLVSNGSCPNCRVSLLEPPPPTGGEHRQVAVDIWSH